VDLRSIRSTTRSAPAIRDISGTIASTSEIATAVEERERVTQEVPRNIHLAAQGTHDIASNIGEVQRSANEIGCASSQVLLSARAVPEQSARLVPGIRSCNLAR
jgi:methyl-accepting chemotaxis protein